MGVFGSYGVVPRDTDDPVAFFRRVARAHGAADARVSAHPKTLAGLRAVLARYPVEHDFASVVVEERPDDVRAAIQRLAAETWPDGIADRVVRVSATSAQQPWRELGVRDRAALEEVDELWLDRRQSFVCTWRKHVVATKLSAKVADALRPWRERRESEHLAGVLRRLGDPREPRLETWKDDDGMRLARATSFGTEQSIFPSESSGVLTLAMPAPGEKLLALALALLDERPRTITVRTHGTGAAILANEAWWPEPTHVHCPWLRAVAIDALEPLPAIEGFVFVTALLRTGARGGTTELKLALTDGAPRLKLSARGGLSARALADLERTLGATIRLEDVH